MASDERFELLPFPYAVALRMRAAGQGHEAIAVAVGVETQSVKLLLELGEEKLAELDPRGALPEHPDPSRERGTP